MQTNDTTITIGGYPVRICSDPSAAGILFTLIGRNPLTYVEGLDTVKAKYVYSLAKDRNLPLRFSFVQLALPLEQWEDIQQLHHTLALMENGSAWSHLSLPCESYILNADPARFSEFDLKAAGKLVSLFNAEAWMNYCQWSGEEMRETLKTFLPDALDEYQLQARIEDYLHELRSTILAEIRKDIAAALAEQEKPGVKDDTNKLLPLEKIIVAGREKLIKSLVIKWQMLKDIVESIGKIESAHPELHLLKVHATLLLTAMGEQLNIPEAPRLTWPQRLLLLQLLDQELCVVSGVAAAADDGRGCLVFAVRAALAELSQKVALDDLFMLSKKWSEGNRGEATADALRKLVLANIKGLHLKASLTTDNSVRTNPDLTTFLPNI